MDVQGTASRWIGKRPRVKVVFRVDASLQIGTGHVMRCLTLADALMERGAECHFVCREHRGNLLELIQQRGHIAHAFPLLEIDRPRADESLGHAACLGGHWREDATHTAEVLNLLTPDWLIVDHYALDVQWESVLRGHCRQIMVIDDLADRRHDCDLLLDQTLGRSSKEYERLVPDRCLRLIGVEFALLRPEFVRLREYSVRRREAGALERLLIMMGGVDAPNATTRVLKALNSSSIPFASQISVVMGQQAPWVESVKRQASTMRCVTEVRSNPPDLVQLMADSDIAIGAAGSASWERCCLGLPTLVVILAENQRPNAMALSQMGAAYLLGDLASIDSAIERAMRHIASKQIAEMSRIASGIVDGRGAARVCQYLSITNRVPARNC